MANQAGCHRTLHMRIILQTNAMAATSQKMVYGYSSPDAPVCQTDYKGLTVIAGIDAPPAQWYNTRMTKDFGGGMDKNDLRMRISQAKRAMTSRQIEARSAALAQKLFATAEYRAAHALFAYIPINQEVRTQPVIRRAWADGKRVAVPRVEGDALRFIWIDSFCDLAEGAFGIPEPPEDGAEADDETALLLVPGLAFDRAGHRVGYGGGYYDRYLAAHPHHPTLALCYGFQLVERLAAEAHDVPVDSVIAD